MQSNTTSSLRRPRWQANFGAPLVALVLISSATIGQAAEVQVPTATLAPASEAGGFVLTGAVQAVRQVTVSAQVGGSVTALAVRAGDRVKAGQLIARIDERSADAGLRGAAAGVDQAEALLQSARQQLERNRELRQQGFISQAAVDAAEAQHRAAQAGLEQARAGRAQATLARGFASATAPFDALVLATHLEAGDLAQPGRPIASLYAPGQMRAIVEVPASRAALARSASRIETQLPDGRWVQPGKRTELPSADPVSQTVEWRLDLPVEVTRDLTPGQSVQVRFVGGTPAASTTAHARVPARALVQRGELSAVYAVQDGRFVLRPVRLGADFGQAGIEVLAGLKPGERFALDGVRAGLAGAAPAP